MTTLSEVRPFTVKNGKRRFRFTPEPNGGFSVSCIGVKGVNTQGDTFEEALNNALEAFRVMAEFREELAAENAVASKTRRRPSRPAPVAAGRA